MRKITDEYLQLENNLKTEYIFVKNIKNQDEAIVNVLESKTTGERILVKYFNGTADVYKKLLNFSHPNLPKVYKVVEADRKCIVVEEFIDGITVDETLQIERYSSASVKKIILQLCNVLSVIHQDGIVHRDIKPENIIVDNNGNVKLLDFNISRINKDNQSKDTLMLGTTGFAAPEQYGISETDARSDIYSIGILINVMLTGEHPSKKLCTGKWQRIVNKCTRINPKDRYNNVKELEADLSTNKFIVPLAMSAIIVLVAITIVVCSGRHKTLDTKPETSPIDLQVEATETIKEIETTTVGKQTTEEEVTTEVTTTDEEVTTEEATMEVPTTEEATTEVPTTEVPTIEAATTEEPTTEAPTVSNYSVTYKDFILTIKGNGEITKKHLEEPYFDISKVKTVIEVVLDEGITNIPSYAFNGWDLIRITIPDTVTYIGDLAMNATILENVTVPGSVEYLGNRAFSGANFWEVTLSEGIKTIDSGCFSGCEYLSDIKIPESVEYIGPNCFAGSDIRSIVLPSELKSLEEMTFVCCEYLRGITLPDKLESIGDRCFAQCPALESITIPPSVTYMGEGVFSDCLNLVVYVTPGSYAEQYCIDNRLEYGYVDSVALKTVEITSSLGHLENSTFANDFALEEIILHEDFTALDDYVFYGCINMKRVVIPPSVTMIGENCFLGCDNLVIYVTPGSYAEQYCIDNQLNYEYVE